MPEWLAILLGAAVIGGLAFAAARHRQTREQPSPITIRPMEPAPYEHPDFQRQPDPESPYVPLSADPSISPRYFKLAVVGESFKNDDGTSRQSIIFGCKGGEDIALVPEPDNPKDKRAVSVRLKSTGEQIGYLKRGHGLTKSIAAGCIVSRIHAIHGRYSDAGYMGVVLDVWLFQPPPKKVSSQKRRKSVAKE